MSRFCESARKATTFLFAVFLWLHALFFLNLPAPLIFKYTSFLSVTTSEVVLFGLLVAFSLLAASGFWKMLLSLAYIYFFPFVLLAYVLYGCFRILRSANRWFKQKATQLEGTPPAPKKSPITIAQVIPSTPGKPADKQKKSPGLLLFLLRPFQRFMVLWCILLLATTHSPVVWMCLIVVLVHLARKVFNVLRTLLIFDLWLGKLAQRILKDLEPVLASLAAVSEDTDTSKDLEKLWNQAKLLRRVFNFLKTPYLVSRWAWVIGIVFIGSIYTYFAVLFSFAYYGIARVNGVSYSWPEALTASFFIPFFVSELPKVLAVKVLGGIQCTLVVVIGIGTIMKFLRHRLDAICKAAAEASDRFTDQRIREKYIILEEKFSKPPSAVQAGGPGAAGRTKVPQK
jgi:hypothetical protein